MELIYGDLRLVVTRIPRDVRKLMMDHQLYLGGGFIRETIAGNKVNDIDLFGTSKDSLQLISKVIAEKRDARRFETENAITVLSNNRMPVQLITRWLFDTPSALIESFDFTVCQSVVWFDREQRMWKSMISDRFYVDLAARRLVYTSPRRDEEAGGSMMRVRKFLARGYTIQAQSLGAVIARLIRAVKMDEVDRAENPEEKLARVCSGLLREVDPNIVLDGLDPIDEHETINDNKDS
jgi:hypothetical protein